MEESALPVLFFSPFGLNHGSILWVATEEEKYGRIVWNNISELYFFSHDDKFMVLPVFMLWQA